MQIALLQWLSSRRGTLVMSGFFVLCLLLSMVGGVGLMGLALPLGLCYALLLIVDFKAAWWILLVGMVIAYDIEFSGGKLATSVPDEPLMALFLLSGFLLMAFRPQLMPRAYLRNPLMLLVVMQYIWLLVSVIYAEIPPISIKFFLAKNWFMASFFLMPLLIFREKADFRKGFRLMFWPMLGIVLYIFVVHAVKYRFGFREIEQAIPDIFYNHVDYGTILSMTFPLLVGAWYLMRRHSVARWAMLGVLLFWLVAISTSYARGAVLAVAFAGVMFVAIRLRLANWVMPVFYGVLVAAIFWLSNHSRYLDFYPDYERTYSHATFTDHMIATFKGQDMSSAERFYRWIAAARMSEDRPWTGVGPNAFYEYYKPYTVTTFRTYVSRNPERSTTHNYFLFMLVEQGWPAMILYGLLVAVYFAQAQKVYHRFRDRYWRVVTLSIACMFAAGFVNNFFSELIETHKVGAFYYLSLSLMMVLDAISRRQNAPVQKAGS